MKNKIEDLRNHLFETLEALKDPDKPMEIDRARAVADVAKVIVDSARVEVDMIKATGAATGTGFVPLPADHPPAHRRIGAPTSTDTPLRRCPDCQQQTAQDPCHNCGAGRKRGAPA